MSILNELMLESSKQFSCSTPIRRLSKEEAAAISLYEEEQHDDVTQNSLAEFEENEKRAAVNTSTSPATCTPKIESILLELRECFKYDPNKVNKDDDTTINDEFVDQLGDDDDDDDRDIESRLKDEILKRVECEKQIDELNKSLCDVRQQLSIAIDCEKKRKSFARKMDVSLNKILNDWNSREADFEMKLKKYGHDRQEMLKTQAKLLMRNQLLEEEMRKLSDDLVKEKVNTQSLSNQITALKSQLNEYEVQKVNNLEKIENLKSDVETFQSRNSNLNQEIDKLKSSYENLNKESKEKETNLNSQIEQLKVSNQHMNKKYEILKTEYEKLAKEAKMVVDESEKQYNELNKNLEMEKMSKDSLQVELNVLEEKYENMLKSLQTEFENKINSMKLITLEKEKLAMEDHRNEMEKLAQKSKLEVDKIRSKYHDDLHASVNEYESKLTDLRLKADSYRTEIDRLKRANKDLEQDRNSIRENLKNMLEGQMKEAYQLLGLQPSKSSSNTIKPLSSESIGLYSTTSNYSNEFQNFLSSLTKSSSPEEQPPPLVQTTSSRSATLFPSFGSLSIIPTNNEPSSSSSGSSSSGNNNKVISPVVMTQQSRTAPSTSSLFDQILDNKEARQKSTTEVMAVSTSTSTSAAIKDEFILNQIDLINKYYQIDSKTLVSTVASSSMANLATDHFSSSDARKEGKSLNLKSPSLNCEEQFENIATEKNTSSTSSSRANELKHYIEMLLNRSPSEVSKQQSEVVGKATSSAAINQQQRRHQEDMMAEIERKEEEKEDQEAVNSSASLGTQSLSNDENEHERGGAAVRIATKKLVSRQRDSLFYGHNDMSDSESASVATAASKPPPKSLDYYDDVKKNLNFDDDDEDEDDADEEDEDDDSENQLGGNMSNGGKKAVNFVVDLRTQTSKVATTSKQQQSASKSTTPQQEHNLSTSSRATSMISLSTVTSASSMSLLRPNTSRITTKPNSTAGRKKWK